MQISGSEQESIDLYGLSRAQLAALLQSWGYSDYHAAQLWRSLYRSSELGLQSGKDLRSDLLTRLRSSARAEPLAVYTQTDSADGFTRKFLLRLSDNQMIETVLMRFQGRATACVSTQVGCAMGCVFCATGQMGFTRHLAAGEIVGQVLHIWHLLHKRGETLRNVVLMGMGEPLHNYDQTMLALEIIMDHNGLALAPKHITLSTVGIVPGIRRLADEQRPFRLAVSLHAATDAERAALVPPARRWPLDELIAACRYYSRQRRRRVFFEWTLIAGKNDTADQAHALGQLLHDLDAHVNLIPLNPTLGYQGIPAHQTSANSFQAILSMYGLPSTIRQRRGIDIAAGCGQLRARETTPPAFSIPPSLEQPNG